MTFDRITVDPDLMGGVPTIRGLRIPVAAVVSMNYRVEDLHGDRVVPAQCSWACPHLNGRRW